LTAVVADVAVPTAQHGVARDASSDPRRIDIRSSPVDHTTSFVARAQWERGGTYRKIQLGTAEAGTPELLRWKRTES
jgi:hypothetical protein